MSFRVCLPTAGTGSRLEGLTRYLNKSLVSISNRPIISHIIEQFPDDTEFVIALGHKGNLVRNFLELVYPEKTFFYSNVDPYEGPGSGLGLSLLSCKQYLQLPFVFISCDTLIKNKIPEPNQNWMGYAELNDLTQYRTLQIDGGKVVNILEKGNKEANIKPYIGLAGIHDHVEFWEAMEEGGSDAVKMGESCGFRALIEKGIDSHAFQWCDTGNPEALRNARDLYKEPNSPNILDKANEAIWFVGEKVIKFSDDKEFILNRAKRGELISNYVPEILDVRPNMYLYKKAPGQVMSEVANLPLFEKLLSECKEFWKQSCLSQEKKVFFKQSCMKFYKTKTEQRIQLFYDNFEKSDGTESINGEVMPLLSELLRAIDWEWISEGLPVRFHGDLHFENILWSKEKNRFVFLDWRQEFAGFLESGDLYYDLAKLMHGLIVSHELIHLGQFTSEWKTKEINYDLCRKQILVECEKFFDLWIVEQGYDLKKVRVLTALIYLNIAALHHHPYSLMLYALGKKMLRNQLSK
jgi:choline kinase